MGICESCWISCVLSMGKDMEEYGWVVGWKGRGEGKNSERRNWIPKVWMDGCMSRRSRVVKWFSVQTLVVSSF